MGPWPCFPRWMTSDVELGECICTTRHKANEGSSHTLAQTGGTGKDAESRESAGLDGLFFHFRAICLQAHPNCGLLFCGVHTCITIADKLTKAWCQLGNDMYHPLHTRFSCIWEVPQAAMPPYPGKCRLPASQPLATLSTHYSSLNDSGFSCRRADHKLERRPSVQNR